MDCRERRQVYVVCARQTTMPGNDDRRELTMRIVFVGALSVLVIFGSVARAADTAAVKEKAELCAGCHGDGGISQTENIPSLAGQPDQFIQWQLVFFRSRARKKEQMQPIVAGIRHEDNLNLRGHVASI